MLSNYRIRKNDLETPFQSGKSLIFSIFVHVLIVFLLVFNPIIAKRRVDSDFVYQVSIITESPKPKAVNRQKPKNKKVIPEESKNKNELEKKTITTIPEIKISKENSDQKPVMKKVPEIKTSKENSDQKPVMKKVPEIEISKENSYEKPVMEKVPLIPESLETPESIYEELADSTPRYEPVEIVEKPLDAQPTGNKIEARVDDAEFPYGWYISGLKNKINFRWEPADLTILRGNTISVILAFRIKENGKVENVFVEKSSGIQMFDNSAIRAVYNSVPFPPFPDGYKGDYLDIHFEFEYHKVKNKG